MNEIQEAKRVMAEAKRVMNLTERDISELKQSNKRDFIVGGIIVAAVLLVFVTAVLARTRAFDDLHAEAVKHGAGCWEADEKGNAVFRWIDKTTPEAKP